VTGGAYSFPPQYDGVVFFTDYYDGFIRVIKQIGSDWYPLFTQPGQPDPLYWGTGMDEIVKFEEGPDGALYYLDLFPGSLHRIIFTGSPLGSGDDGMGSRVRLRAWPNPFRLQSSGLVIERFGSVERFTVDIVSLDGRMIRRLESESRTQARWDGRDDRGTLAAAGVYFLRVQSENALARIVLLP
jgi:hypothetical protein